MPIRVRIQKQDKKVQVDAPHSSLFQLLSLFIECDMPRTLTDTFQALRRGSEADSVAGSPAKSVDSKVNPNDSIKERRTLQWL